MKSAKIWAPIAVVMGSIAVAHANCDVSTVVQRPTGELTYGIAEPDASAAQVWLGPEAMTIDSAGNILVADERNSRILVFDPQGKNIDVLKLPIPAEQASGSTGRGVPAMTVDRGGKLYVVLGWQYRVLVYSRQRKLIREIEYGRYPLLIIGRGAYRTFRTELPARGVLVDEDGRVLIHDGWKSGGVFAPDGALLFRVSLDGLDRESIKLIDGEQGQLDAGKFLWHKKYRYGFDIVAETQNRGIQLVMFKSLDGRIVKKCRLPFGYYVIDTGQEVVYASDDAGNFYFLSRSLEIVRVKLGNKDN